MAKVSGIKGLPQVLSNLKRAGKKVAAGVERGLKKGGLHLQRCSQKIVPVNMGNLKGSSFCRSIGGVGFATDIVVGYTAKYAVFVHEDLNKAHGEAFNVKYAEKIAAGLPGFKGGRGPGQQAKFLEKPARDERRTIIRIVQKEARL